MTPDDLELDTMNLENITSKDSRYDSRAYEFVLFVISLASEELEREDKGRSKRKKHISGMHLLEVYRDLMLDKYGPMAWTVSSSWGVNSCEDVGEIVFILVDEKMITKSDTDSKSDFIGCFDLKESLTLPYAI